ncbi:MAG: hypothetical protein NC409_09965 [Clostridium sp.]|nr:hypothetical protein [Clostridium sp.]
MNQTISLNGTWELGYCDFGCGIRPPYTLRCPVPGDVRMAFLDAGIIREPLVDENTLDCRFLESKEFWYRRTFTAPSVSGSARKLLTFHGLDCTADLWLNDIYLGRHNNAFVEAEYDVSALVTAGENTLVVRIDSGVAEAKKHPLDDMGKMWNPDQPYRVLMRKPQFVYGWDWTPWLETCGIWRDVTLTVYEQAAITDLSIHQPDASVPIEHDTITVQADITLDVVSKEDYSISAAVYGDARYDSAEAAAILRGKDGSITKSAHYDMPLAVAADCVHISPNPHSSGTVTCSLTLPIPDAKLWWSNGLGNPYLYKIEVTLYTADETPIQTVTQDYGIRSISLREEPLSETERGFTFVLNGVPVFCKGANHVPADCLIGRITDEKTTALVNLAADSHMNMLRVWGGGFYESEAFMNACDRRGIMVWHDFMFACGYYPDHDPDFVALVKDEAVRAVTRLRRHSSLIGWSGNNEIQEMYHSMMTYDPLSRPYGMKLFQEILPAIVKEYCPNLIYRESSPFGGDDPAGCLCGDQHIWHFTHRPQFEHYLDLVHFTDFPIKFLSEFGIIGAMSLESTKRALPSLWNAKDEPDRESAAWLHHCNTSSDHHILELIMSAYFSHTKEMGLQEYLLKSQALQAELTKYLYEEFRRRKFVCSGLLFWTLSDSWGIHNWSLIDYYLDKKPIYYALKRAMRPIVVSVKGYCPQSFEAMRSYRDYYAGTPDALEIWLSNDTLQKEDVLIRYTICLFDGTVLQSGEQRMTLAENVSVPALTVPIRGLISAPEQTVMHAEVYRGDTLLSDADYLFAPYKELALSPAAISYRVEELADSGGLRLTLRADRFVWMLHIGGTDRITVSDNDFHMLPGREYVVTVRPFTASHGSDTCSTASRTGGTPSADLHHDNAHSTDPLHADTPLANAHHAAAFVPQLHSAGAEPTAAPL